MPLSFTYRKHEVSFTQYFVDFCVPEHIVLRSKIFNGFYNTCQSIFYTWIMLVVLLCTDIIGNLYSGFLPIRISSIIAFANALFSPRFYLNLLRYFRTICLCPSTGGFFYHMHVIASQCSATLPFSSKRIISNDTISSAPKGFAFFQTLCIKT
jgi:hypothetical protein